MKTTDWLEPLAALAGLLVSTLPAAAEPETTAREIPAPLQPWSDWALWDVRDLDSPTPYHDQKQALRLWPSRLTLEADGSSGRFSFEVMAITSRHRSARGNGR